MLEDDTKTDAGPACRVCRQPRMPQGQMASAKSESLAYRVKDAARLMGIGRSKVFELIKDGHLPAIKIGGATLVLRVDIIAFLEGAPQTHGRN